MLPSITVPSGAGGRQHHDAPRDATNQQRRGALSFLVHLDCLVAISDEGPLPPWTVADRPGAPKQAQVTANGALVTVVAFPFADMLLAFLQGLCGNVELFSFWAPEVATSVAQAMRWGRFPLVVASRGPSVVPLSLTSVRKPYEAVASTVIVDHLSAATYGWHPLLASSILAVHHHGVFQTREALAQHRHTDATRHDAASAMHPLRPHRATFDGEVDAAAMSHGRLATAGGHSANSILRRALRSLALLPVMQRALRLFEVYVSGATRPTVQACVSWIESSLFDGRVFAVDDGAATGNTSAAGSRLRRRQRSGGRWSEEGVVSAEGMAAALRIARYGGTIAAAAASPSSNEDEGAIHVDVVVSIAPHQLDDDEEDTTSTSDGEDTAGGATIGAEDAPPMRNVPAAAPSRMVPVTDDTDVADDDGSHSRHHDPPANAAPTMVVDVAWVDACIRCWTILPNNSITAFVEDDMSDVDDVQRYVVAHLMLLLAPPPMANASMDVETLHGVLERCGVSRAPLEDQAFLDMMTPELDLEYAPPSPTTAKEGSDAAVIDEAVSGEDLYENEAGGGRPSADVARPLVAFRAKSGRFSSVPGPTQSLSGVVGEMARRRAQALRRTLGNELVEVLRRPQTSDAGTQCWLSHRASVATMTVSHGPQNDDTSSSGPSSAAVSKAALLPNAAPYILRLEDLRAMAQQQQQHTLKPTLGTAGVPPVPVGQQETSSPSQQLRVVPSQSVASSVSSAMVEQPMVLQQGATPVTAMDAHQQAVKPTPVHHTTTPRAASRGSEHLLRSTNDSGSVPPPPASTTTTALLPPPPPPPGPSADDPSAHLFVGMLPMYSSVTHRVAGTVAPDAMHCDLPLYAYGIDLDRVGNTLKAFKALFACDKKLLDGAMFSVHEAPASSVVVVRGGTSASSSSSSFLRISFRTQMDATHFIAKNRPHAPLTVKGGVRVLLLPEGLELCRMAPPPPPMTRLATAARGRSDDVDRRGGSHGSRLRRRSRSRRATRSRSRSRRRRSRSRSSHAPPARKHLKIEERVSPQDVPPEAVSAIGPISPEVAAASGLPFEASLTPTELETLHRIGSNPRQVVENPANVEFFAFESLHGHDAAQRTILICVAKARAYSESSAALPAPQLPPTAWRR